MTPTCVAGLKNLAVRIKYFYCLSQARTFFESSDANLGSGVSVLKLLHNGSKFEDS